MTKIILFLFCALASQGFAQTLSTSPLSRQLYEHYFKRLYTYEPALIRENKIDELEIKSVQKMGDSTLSSIVKEKGTFREDGRPKRRIVWSDYHRDSTIVDYCYDSLGNLVEYRSWKPKDRYEKVDQEFEHLFFHYENTRLLKVFSYSMRTGDDYSRLNFCDSLSYQHNNQKVAIMHGNANAYTIIYTAKPTFIYPINTQHIKELISSEKESVDKPIDKESLWKTACVYPNPILKELQKLTGKECLSKEIVNICNAKSTLVYRNGKLELSPEPKNFFPLEIAIFVDTLERNIYVKQHFSHSEPTSLEDRITSTISILSFDYSLRLYQMDAIRESSRGNREYSRDSTQTYYTYFDFGLLQRKVEYHYNQNAFAHVRITNSEDKDQQLEYNPVVIFEEETVIKTR